MRYAVSRGIPVVDRTVDDFDRFMRERSEVVVKD
jgi:hypothetical protein